MDRVAEGTDTPATGQIIILNGAPRSGKTSIARAIQDSFDGPPAGGVWINLGVDVFMRATPKKWQPGVGLRPGEEQHHVYPLVPRLYAALYDAIAAVSRSGLNVVVDVGHHDAAILADCARHLAGLPVLFVGVRCPIEEIMRRREESGPDAPYLRGTPDDPVPEPVRRWQERVHGAWAYDLELDTSALDPGECAAVIRRRLEEGPGTAIAALGRGSVS
jgi:chloramphenicol 3-O phosphotransferase